MLVRKTLPLLAVIVTIIYAVNATRDAWDYIVICVKAPIGTPYTYGT